MKARIICGYNIRSFILKENIKKFPIGYILSYGWFVITRTSTEAEFKVEPDSTSKWIMLIMGKLEFKEIWFGKRTDRDC